MTEVRPPYYKTKWFENKVCLIADDYSITIERFRTSDAYLCSLIDVRGPWQGGVNDSAWQPSVDLAHGTFYHPLKLQLQLQTDDYMKIINDIGMYIVKDLHWEVKSPKIQ